MSHFEWPKWGKDFCLHHWQPTQTQFYRFWKERFSNTTILFVYVPYLKVIDSSRPGNNIYSYSMNENWKCGLCRLSKLNLLGRLDSTLGVGAWFPIGLRISSLSKWKDSKSVRSELSFWTKSLWKRFLYVWWKSSSFWTSSQVKVWSYNNSAIFFLVIDCFHKVR